MWDPVEVSDDFVNQSRVVASDKDGRRVLLGQNASPPFANTAEEVRLFFYLSKAGSC